MDKKTISELAEENGVIKLRKNNFSLEDEPILIDDRGHPFKGFTTVMYYADWCGWCHKTAPILFEACRSSVCFAKKNGDINASKCHVCILERGKMKKNKRDIIDDQYIDDETFDEKVGVNGFPTIKQYLHGKYYRDFEGERTPAKLILFISGVDNYQNVQKINKSRKRNPFE